MLAASYSKVRERLKEYCDRATDDYETVIITRERGENVVLLSESTYNNLMENLYIRSNRRYYDELIESIAQLKKGKCQKRNLVDE